MEVFGLIAFVFVMFLYSEVDKLKKQLKNKDTERIENGDLSELIADRYLNKVVKIQLDMNEVSSFSFVEKEWLVVDVDQQWVLVRSHKQKSQTEKLVRISLIKSISE